MDSFIGTILPVAFNYAPQGWAFCNGQAMSISQNSALFALIGTTYGGDGVNTFNLPDLRGRMPVGAQAPSPNLPNVAMGQLSGAASATLNATGSATVALTTANLPAHNHGATFTPTGGSGAPEVTVHVSSDIGTSAAPIAGGYLAALKPPGPGASQLAYRADAGAGTVALNGATASVTGGAGGGGTVSVANTGGATPLAAPVSVTGQVATMSPGLGINFIICIQGIFPSRQ